MNGMPGFDAPEGPSEAGAAGLEDMQHWASVMARAQAMLTDHALTEVPKLVEAGTNMDVWQKQWADWVSPEKWPDLWQKNLQQSMAAFSMPMAPASKLETPKDPDAAVQQWMQFSASLWNGEMWQNAAAPFAKFTQAMTGGTAANTAAPEKDRRFSAEEWQASPIFALIRHSYGLIADQLLKSAEKVDGLDPKMLATVRYATQGLVDASAPSNFLLTNPQVMARAQETRGESLLKGLEHMLTDLKRGQMTHTDPDAFKVGENIAITPGKVVHETPLYQLIHYAPTTDTVLDVPLVIFPPWINRFYILDLNPAKSFVGWAVEQSISTFMVSWKSADASMADVVWDDYIAAQIDAISVIRNLLGVPHVHAIGYCVAGTTLAATLAILAAKDAADMVKSATFFTAQVDFELAGDLRLFVDDAQLKLLDQLSAPGYLDGRYMAATFNALRGRDLIWNYVVNNYLMGQDYPPFDLLHWNGDTTNLPAKWHRQYLTDLYRDNRLVEPNSLSALGTPIDLRRIETPIFVQAGKEDHIAPAESVWRMRDHVGSVALGRYQFILAGSGHIAGVVNPPVLGKYQYWTNDADVDTLDEFVAGAAETKGSWWPHWLGWLKDQDGKMVAAKGARIPGAGGSIAIEDAPGRYVKSR
jgi:polyhydroxyalkanoate synthase subunit PhaC